MISRAVWPILAFLFSAGWLLYLIPGASYFVLDPDGGFFIEGAYHLRKTGEHPQIDFLSSYGPLSFYLRAIAQAVIGDNLWSEVVLVTMGYALSFLVLYVGAQRSSKSHFFAVICLVAALFCLPRIYKFFVILVPALIFLVTLIHAEKPTRATAVGIGMVVGIAFLFRHDYGAYALAVAVVAICLAKTAGHFRRVVGIAFLCGCAAVLLPWIAFLLYEGKFFQHIYDLINVSSSYNSGLGLPHPLVSYTNPVATLMYAMVYVIPLVLILLICKLYSLVDNVTRLQTFCAIAVSLVFLGQSAHRADLGHLFQSTGAGLLGLGMAWRLGGVLKNKYSAMLRAAIVGLTLSVALVGLSRQYFNFRNVRQVLHDYSKFGWSADKIAEDYIAQNPDSPSSKTIQLLRCLPADRRIMILPFAPQLAYFSGRVFAGNTLLVAPGYFDSEFHQKYMIDALIRHNPVAIVWNEKFSFDGNPLRNPVVTHSDLYRYVSSTYQEKGNVGGYTVFMGTDDYSDYSERCLSLPSIQGHPNVSQ